MGVRLPLTQIEGIIREGIQTGLSLNKILQMYRSSGGAIRTKVFYEIGRQVLQSIDFEKVIKKIEPKKKLPIYKIPRTKAKIPARFQFIVRVETSTGEEFQFGIYTDEIMSKAEIYKEAEFLTAFDYGVVPRKIEVIRARRRY